MIDNITIENVINMAKSRMGRVDVKLLRKAHEFAIIGHEGQKRKSGEDYIQHPLHTAFTLAKMGMTSETIVAGILHDIAEDTGVSLEEVKKEFGEEIAFLVNGVTKIGNVRLSKERAQTSWQRDKNQDIGEERSKKETEEEEKEKKKILSDFEEGEDDGYKNREKEKTAAEKEMHKIDREYVYLENLRRMILAMAADIRIILIKLADRLHNMQTLDVLPPQKQYRIAKETMEIYAPIANRLGIGGIKSMLEDLAFSYVYPRKYREIEKMTRGKFRQKEKAVAQAIEEMREVLAKENQKIIDIHGRAKHLYSLYHKLLRHHMNLSRIYDLVAIRIIVPEVANCYEVLGIIHKYYKPLIGRIKDYISLPKPNGYRSLHTTIFGPGKEIIEVQIRTPQMHYEAEFGIAAHWIYTEQRSFYSYFLPRSQPAKHINLKELAWVKQLENWHKEIGGDPKEFFESLKIDFFQDRIFAFTPKGDVINLPEGATPVDFAYLVHTEVGHSCIGAAVNGQKVPLDYKISNGEVVEIVTNRSKKNPDRKWLEFVKTSQARSKIKTWLRKSSRRGLPKS
ncbi:MAG: bifunctional (p)ppGpp synthetase/guanosine-3',5'-bis(diphosphate) 3'-pyrophosphohydrolase [Candidatus Moranbacteria bacterium]|nr:bifunctional (p)ppGpp synthetase/guanosine-3',5'-bis(diphosphate) 3'-pyrophosphohydrolase [Candidatus Moranbacteria bacterium]